MRRGFRSKLGGAVALFTVPLLGAGAAIAADFNGDGYDDLMVGAPGEAPGMLPRSGVVFAFRGSAMGLRHQRVIDQAGLGQNELGDEFGSAFATGDFDGDGRGDVAIGAPGEAPGISEASGAVFVFLGASGGVVPDIVLDQSDLGMNEVGDRFVATLAAGDFNGDGFDDLAVGAPGKAPAGDPRSGAVFLFRGSAVGLAAHDTIDQAGLGQNEANDRFGAALATGDFDGDERMDLAVGAPGEAPGTQPRSGLVFVFRGVDSGLAPDRVVDQTGLGANEQGDQFGATLATGDFDGDGPVDLVVGAPGEAPGGDPRSGALFVFSGSRGGLVADRFLDQSGLGRNELGDELGRALSTGDFDGDGLVDLAAGAPGEAPGIDPRSGGVFVFRGTVLGLAPERFLSQAQIGANEAGDRFGAALASGDYDGDGIEDLAVGTPGEAPHVAHSGGIFVFQGTAAGLQPQVFLDQGVLGANEYGDLFGAALSE
jgi:hypothetical protein